MRLTKTATAAASAAFATYVHNCQRNAQCELPFTAPVPGLPYLELYVDFGAFQPLFVELRLQDVCDVGHSEQVFPSNYVVGQTPEGGWYGVFKYLNEPLTPVSDFVIWMNATVVTPAGLVDQTFFSEMLTVETCQPIMKVKSCHPEGATTTGFDVNGLYYGLPVGDTFLGMDAVRYFHIVYVRRGKARELPPKATFTASLFKNFRTIVEKNWSLECEIVPRWFKDELLAVHSRGAVQLDEGATYLVTDLAYEALNDDDLMWKAFAQLKETTRLYYGCDDGVCNDCCSPVILSASANEDSPSDSGSGSGGCVPVALPEDSPSAPNGQVGVPYSFSLPLDGTPPFVVTPTSAPGWMTMTPTPTGVDFTGTPDAPGTTINIEFDVSNDCGAVNNIGFFIDVTA